VSGVGDGVALGGWVGDGVALGVWLGFGEVPGVGLGEGGVKMAVFWPLEFVAPLLPVFVSDEF
jgi:hypothetical protein